MLSIVEDRFGKFLFDVSPSRRMIQFNRSQYFLNLPKIRFLVNLDSLDSMNCYVCVCFVDKKGKCLPSSFPNIANYGLLCMPRSQKVELFFDSDKDKQSLAKKIFKLFLQSSFKIPSNKDFAVNLLPFLFGCNCRHSNYSKMTYPILPKKDNLNREPKIINLSRARFEGVFTSPPGHSFLESNHSLNDYHSLNDFCLLCSYDKILEYCWVNNLRNFDSIEYEMAHQFFAKWQQKSIQDKNYDFIEDKDHSEAFEYLSKFKHNYDSIFPSGFSVNQISF